MYNGLVVGGGVRRIQKVYCLGKIGRLSHLTNGECVVSLVVSHGSGGIISRSISCEEDGTGLRPVVCVFLAKPEAGSCTSCILCELDARKIILREVTVRI